MFRCPKCKRYISNVVAWRNGNEDITEVKGTCKKHGEVEPEEWDYDDFVWEAEAPKR